ETDRDRAAAAVTTMQSTLPLLPDDPYLLLSTEPEHSERIQRGTLPPLEEATATIFEAAEGSDLVGIYASGPIRRAFASSLGHRRFHEVDSLQFDFSLYYRADKAVSRSHSTANWDAAELRARIASAKEALELLRRPSKTIAPGRYRAYLSPAALGE